MTARPWLVFTVCGLATFMATLDAGIVNVALPAMARWSGAGLSYVQWTVSGYLLVACVFLPVCGRLGDMLGPGRMFRLGLAGFTLGSALCGLAPGLPALIGARMLQGLGATALMAVCPAIILRAFPGPERGRALGSTATVVALGSLTGPAVGGLLLARFGWPAIFYVNVPIGAVTWLMASKILPLEPARLAQGRDLAGAVWPMVDLSLLGDRVLAKALLACLLAYMASMFNAILLPFYLSDQMGLDPEHMGLVMAILPVTIAVAAPISGYASEKMDPGLLSLAGLGLFCAGMLNQAGLAAGSPLWRVQVSQVLLGLGFGVFNSPNNNTIMSEAPAGKTSQVGAMQALVRNVGMVAGVVAATAIFENLRKGLWGLPGSGFYCGMQAAYFAAACLAGLGALLCARRVRAR